MKSSVAWTAEELFHENRRLREALEYYANPKNYQGEIRDRTVACPVEFDGGEVARKALGD